jgi:cell division protein FtsI/penicillin-binding protein 2
VVERVKNLEYDGHVQTQLQGLQGEQKEAKLAELQKTATEQAQFSQWRNKAVSDPYEPGSVFKVITAAAALETDSVTPHGSILPVRVYTSSKGAPKPVGSHRPRNHRFLSGGEVFLQPNLYDGG